MADRKTDRIVEVDVIIEEALDLLMEPSVSEKYPCEKTPNWAR